MLVFFIYDMHICDAFLYWLPIMHSPMYLFRQNVSINRLLDKLTKYFAGVMLQFFVLHLQVVCNFTDKPNEFLLFQESVWNSTSKIVLYLQQLTYNGRCCRIGIHMKFIYGRKFNLHLSNMRGKQKQFRALFCFLHYCCTFGWNACRSWSLF